MAAFSYKVKLSCIVYIAIAILSIPGKALAVDAVTFTLDNDLFIASDDGYTNGIYGSWYYYGFADQQPEISWLVQPLKWSLRNKQGEFAVSAYSIGQSIFTPEDILRTNPDPDDIPYAGLLFISNTHVVSHGTYADSISTIVGVIGPISGAERMQKFFHRLTDSELAQGWGSQLENEVIFKFTRGRSWRNWVSENGRYDVLSGANIGIGTLESSINAGVTFRYGNQLSMSHVSGSFILNRTSNFIAVNNGWFAYLMIGTRLVANQINFDGNTFRDSRSVKLDHTHLALTSGLAYSWGDISATLAYADYSFTDNEHSNLSRLGTLTIAWFFD